MSYSSLLSFRLHILFEYSNYKLRPQYPISFCVLLFYGQTFLNHLEYGTTKFAQIDYTRYIYRTFSIPLFFCSSLSALAHMTHQLYYFRLHTARFHYLILYLYYMHSSLSKIEIIKGSPAHPVSHYTVYKLHLF